VKAMELRKKLRKSKMTKRIRGKQKARKKTLIISTVL
jgi:hypothetical protein